MERADATLLLARPSPPRDPSTSSPNKHTSLPPFGASRTHASRVALRQGPQVVTHAVSRCVSPLRSEAKARAVRVAGLLGPTRQ